MTEVVNSNSLNETIKRVGLNLSDNVSSLLKLLFTCRFQSVKLVPYESVQKLDRKFYTFSLINEADDIPSLHVIDAQIIYILTNKILGGEGIVEVRRFKELFSFSEHYFGKHFINWVIKAFQENNMKYKLGKLADSPKYYHMFLPDEVVCQFAFEVYIGLQQLGMYYICIDKNYLTAEDKMQTGKKVVMNNDISPASSVRRADGDSKLEKSIRQKIKDAEDAIKKGK